MRMETTQRKAAEKWSFSGRIGAGVQKGRAHRSEWHVARESHSRSRQYYVKGGLIDQTRVCDWLPESPGKRRMSGVQWINCFDFYPRSGIDGLEREFSELVMRWKDETE